MPTRRGDIWNVPNALTFLRLGMIPVFITLLFHNRVFEGLVVFIIAGLTDMLDGFIARRFDITTEFGRTMDPVADKLLLISAFLLLTLKGWIPEYLALTAILRDVALVSGFMFIKTSGREVKAAPTFAGKLSTVLQVSSVIAAMVWPGDARLTALFIASTAVTVLSGIDYARKGFSIYSKGGEG